MVLESTLKFLKRFWFWFVSVKCKLHFSWSRKRIPSSFLEIAHRTRKKSVTYTTCNITDAVKIIEFYLKHRECGKCFEELQRKFGVRFLCQWYQLCNICICSVMDLIIGVNLFFCLLLRNTKSEIFRPKYKFLVII